MTRQRIGTTAAIIVFVLGFIGVGHMLATDPGRLFRQLLFIGIFALIFYVIYRVFMAPKMSAEDVRYRKTAQASKKRVQRPGNNSQVKPSSTKKKKNGSNVTRISRRSGLQRNDGPRLTVIEGKKGKKKKKANM